MGREQDRGDRGLCGSTAQSWCHLVVSRVPVTQLDSRCGDTAGQMLQWHSRTAAARSSRPPQWHSRTTHTHTHPPRARQPQSLGGTARRWPCRHVAPQPSSPRARLLPSPRGGGRPHTSVGPRKGVPGAHHPEHRIPACIVTVRSGNHVPQSLEPTSGLMPAKSRVGGRGG